MFHSTWTWAIDKNNGKQGCAAIRPVHGVLTLAKLLLAVAWKEARLDEHHPPPDSAFHVRGRRRDEAIAMQFISSYRVASSGPTVLRSFRDTANAYSSTAHPKVLDQLEKATS